ncbi:hypothetical protein P8452_02378 [Trifolium repens]|nr:hypothetical protein P8452_02378 [Trifolium repens]
MLVSCIGRNFPPFFWLNNEAVFFPSNVDPAHICFSLMLEYKSCGSMVKVYFQVEVKFGSSNLLQNFCCEQKNLDQRAATKGPSCSPGFRILLHIFRVTQTIGTRGKICNKQMKKEVNQSKVMIYDPCIQW